jgi:hypothetical protein
VLNSQQQPDLKQLKGSEKKYGRDLEQVFGISTAPPEDVG